MFCTMWRTDRRRRYDDDDDDDSLARAIFGACCCCCLAALVVFLSVSGESRRRFLHGHWLPYVIPSGGPAWLWDSLHYHSGDGMWQYSADNVGNAISSYILDAHPNCSSLLDVACNQGFLLNRMQRLRPHARHYGTDISTRMTEAAHERCPRCHGIAQLDLNSLARAPFVGPLPATFPKEYDVVVVADVLYFISWGGWPPALCHALPQSILYPAQRRFFDALTSLASLEVVFSDHQDNACAVAFLRGIGAMRRPVPASHGNGRRGGSSHTPSVWVAPGRSARIATRGTMILPFGEQAAAPAAPSGSAVREPSPVTLDRGVV